MHNLQPSPPPSYTHSVCTYKEVKFSQREFMPIFRAVPFKLFVLAAVTSFLSQHINLQQYIFEGGGKHIKWTKHGHLEPA